MAKVRGGFRIAARGDTESSEPGSEVLQPEVSQVDVGREGEQLLFEMVGFLQASKGKLPVEPISQITGHQRQKKNRTRCRSHAGASMVYFRRLFTVCFTSKTRAGFEPTL